MIRVLHLGTEKSWRGGENQVRLLVEGLKGQVEAQFGATPKASPAFQEQRWNCQLLGLSSGNPWSPINIFKTVQFIKKNRINLMDAHTAKAHTLALNVAPFVPEVKIVVHRRVDNRPKNSLLTKSKYFHKRVDQFIAISRSIGNVLREYGLPEEKITVVRSAVSAEPYKKLDRIDCQRALRAKYHLPENQLLIGNASALSPQKGYETLLRAANELKKRGSHFQILIAGEGELKESLVRLTHELNLHKEVHFIGFVQNVPEFLAGLDILSVPSNNEGLGTIILEGILAGVAVVASEVGGIPEMIEHGKTGRLHPVGDSSALAQNLKDLLESPEERKRLSQEATLRVRTQFSLESMVQGNLSVYKKILQENR